MITIGIRAAPKTVTFAIYDSDSREIINIEEIKIPAAFAAPDALKYLRSNLLDVLREFRVSKAGIRACEPNAQNPDIRRIQMEGVIQEAFASSELTGYYVGHISSITSRLGIPRTDFKVLVNGERDFEVENWGELGQSEREAILCAMAAVNA
ncbi:hypothetical protein [Azospirillum halopraeferens]|uniref:hypothetical protein n=1 Tax=Azospirillum halopraeferens TaxID=34010 RepID=UPI000A008FBF|nr:hypothetical protein [Azospirillum halopraeferens]